jgi:hypothetical protein
MRPPTARNRLISSDQIRPHFGAGPGSSPVTFRNVADENKNDLMTQACIRGHQTAAIPLIETNRAQTRRGDYNRTTIIPKLISRPKNVAVRAHW